MLEWRKWSNVENKIVGPLNLVRFKGCNAGKQVWLFISRLGETHGPECNVNREQTSIYAWAYKSRRCPSSTTKLWPKGTSCALRNACTSSISLAFSYFYLFRSAKLLDWFINNYASFIFVFNPWRVDVASTLRQRIVLFGFDPYFYRVTFTPARNETNLIKLNLLRITFNLTAH